MLSAYIFCKSFEQKNWWNKCHFKCLIGLTLTIFYIFLICAIRKHIITQLYILAIPIAKSITPLARYNTALKSYSTYIYTFTVVYCSDNSSFCSHNHCVYNIYIHITYYISCMFAFGGMHVLKMG